MLHQPIADHAERHAKRRRRQRHEGQQGRKPDPTETRARRDATGAGSNARIARPAAHVQFRHHTDEAQGDENEREERGFRPVKPGPVLGVKLGREGAEAQQRKGPELDQHVERDQQNAAVERRTQLRGDDSDEASPGPVAQRPRGLLQPRIKATQRGGDGQVDQRIIGAGHHQQRAGEVLQPVAERNPRVARDERRNCQRRDGKHSPDLPTRKVRPLDEPGGRRSDDGASRRGGDDQSDRVDEQATDKRTHQQVDGALRAHTRRLNDRDENRQENERSG